MKMLFLSPLPPWWHGGVEKMVWELAKYLSIDHGVDVHVWSGASCNTICSRDAISVRTYCTSKWLGYASLKMFSDIRRSAQDFDIIHACNSSTLIPLITALALRSKLASKGPALVISPVFHPQASNVAFDIPKRLFERTADRYVFRKARSIICVSQTEAQLLRERFALANKLTIIYPGVEIAEVRKATPYPIDGKLILYVWRLERYKNIHRIIEALEHLPPHFVFYIIGEGPFRNELVAMIKRRNLSSRVQLLGSCPDAELHRWLKTSALLVNLSDIESFGITVLEALAAGTPALVNHKLGLGELAQRFSGAVFSIRAEATSSLELAAVITDLAGARIGPVDLTDFQWSHAAFCTIRAYEQIYNASG